MRHNISAWQLCGYAAASMAGLAIIMVAAQFYVDVMSVIDTDSGNGAGLISSRNIVISKPVSVSATLTGEAPAFDRAEIDEILAQPWATSVAPFRAADFGVHARVELGGRSMQTALFLESIADSLLDVNSADWAFSPENPAVPIVIPRDYLALYNFGFASSGRMPMISEAMLSSVPFSLTLSGNGRSQTLPARIVGFSSWLNTIAVPSEFMEWAHERFGGATIENPSRLVVTVGDPSEPAIESFFAERAYEVAGNESDMGRAAYMLRLIITVVIAVGAVITALALGLLILSLLLLVQKNRRIIYGLMLLGFRPKAVSRPYVKLMVVINVCIFIVDVVVSYVCSMGWAGALAAMGGETRFPLTAVCVGAVLTAVVLTINICVIRRLVKRVFMLN